MVIKRFSVIGATLGLLCSCGSPSPRETVDLAYDAVDCGDFGRARELCDGIVLGADSASLGVEDLGRLSLVYMQLADVSDEDVNMAMAARCFNMSERISPDSTAAFYHSVAPEQTRHAMTLISLMRGLAVRPDSLVDDELPATVADSIMETDYE